MDFFEGRGRTRLRRLDQAITLVQPALEGGRIDFDDERLPRSEGLPVHRVEFSLR